MGMYTTTILGMGKTEHEAYRSAEVDLYAEYGYSHDIREVVSKRLVRQVPPQKKVTRRVYTSRGWDEVISWQSDLDAPQEEWYQEWEFVVLVHH